MDYHLTCAWNRESCVLCERERRIYGDRLPLWGPKPETSQNSQNFGADPKSVVQNQIQSDVGPKIVENTISKTMTKNFAKKKREVQNFLEGWLNPKKMKSPKPASESNIQPVLNKSETLEISQNSGADPKSIVQNQKQSDVVPKIVENTIWKTLPENLIVEKKMEVQNFLESCPNPKKMKSPKPASESNIQPVLNKSETLEISQNSGADPKAVVQNQKQSDLVAIVVENTISKTQPANLVVKKRREVQNFFEGWPNPKKMKSPKPASESNIQPVLNKSETLEISQNSGADPKAVVQNQKQSDLVAIVVENTISKTQPANLVVKKRREVQNFFEGWPNPKKMKSPKPASESNIQPVLNKSETLEISQNSGAGPKSIVQNQKQSDVVPKIVENTISKTLPENLIVEKKMEVQNFLESWSNPKKMWKTKSASESNIQSVLYQEKKYLRINGEPRQQTTRSKCEVLKSEFVNFGAEPAVPITPEKNSAPPAENENQQITPPHKIAKVKTFDSIEKTPVNGSPCENTGISPSETRRGRPRAELLNTLILEGSTSPSSIKCSYCSRVFPREKSLQAHLRTHTGERPYVCDYPRCTRRFTQSGQLKTHQRLHTGEKPFICSAPTCENRFTHANRHCPEHPDAQLKRFLTPSSAVIEKNSDVEHSNAIKKWLKNKRKTLTNGENSSVSKKQARVLKLKEEHNENESDNLTDLETFPNNFSKGFSSFSSSSEADIYSSQEIYSCGYQSFQETSQHSQDYMQDFIESPSKLVCKASPSNSPVQQLFKDASYQMTRSEHIELPKKRWLREAVQDQQRWDGSQELARPINWGDDVNIVEYENQRRPTVLMRVQDFSEKKQVSRADMQTAIALVELKNGGPLNYQPF